MTIIVLYFVIIIIYAFIKKKNAFESFSRGIENNYKTILNLFPTILILIVAINIFANSGIIDIMKQIIPSSFLVPELIIQACLKPLSHSSALLIMVKIFEGYGVDSVSGFVASVIQGCSDTTIYVVAIYFGSIKMRKTETVLKAGLLNDLLTFIIVFFICSLFFKA